MAPYTVFTTVADYPVRARFRYQPALVSYQSEQPYYQMVPLGEGVIDYRTFLSELRAGGFDGWVGFEMCAPFVQGGDEDTLDSVARQSLRVLRKLIG
jgi:sugar phosphate isomerase/epimerase